ncbi:MAG TPA: LUD domain-containing protein [Solirubrobacteraceae bacterium]
MSARAEVLGRIRAATGAAAASAIEIPRDYRVSGSGGVELFVDRLKHYDATCRRVGAGELDGAVREVLAGRSVRRLVVPDGLPEAWLTDAEPLRDSPPLSPQELDEADGTISTCAVAIAETGTIVLDGGPGMGRRILSLVPDYLLCVVRPEQIAPSVPEAIARLEPTRPLTFISGPSATVDIEMVRVAGVHGPRRLDVIVAD